jgi:hypothetical protein
MKKILALLVIGLVGYFGYTYLNTENKTEAIQVEDAPVKVSIMYINSTDQPQTIRATWGINKPDTTVIAPGDSVKIQSNCSPNGRVLPTECSEFHCQLLPPASLKQPNPSTGNFWLSYQLEPGGTVKCIRDGLWYSNQDNEGAGPMDNYIWSEYTNWKYELVWSNNPHNQQGNEIVNTLEIKTVECTSVADPSSPSKFSCN